MPFLDDVQGVLSGRRVARWQNRLEVAAVRRRWIAIFDEANQRSPPDEKHRALFATWMEPQWTEALLDRLVPELEAGLMADASDTELATAIDAGLRRMLGLKASLGGWARDRELDRIFSGVRSWAFVERRILPDLATYLRELGCVDDRGRRTRAGDVLHRLRGRAAVEWILNLESELSTGLDDPWRLSADGASTIVECNGRPLYGDADGPELPVVDTRIRLEHLGLLHEWPNPEVGSIGFDLTPLGEALLPAIAERDPTPYRLLAKAILSDQAEAVLGVRGDGETEATIRMARMLAHEIRNALTPAQVAFEDLVEERTDDPDLASRYHGRIRGGFHRVFKVVDDLVNLSEIATAAQGEVSLLSAARDATASLNGNGATVEIRIAQEVTLVGHRQRIVLAIVNILRNAVQAGAHRIAVSASGVEATVDLIVEDDGPGVPAEHREAIFDSGFSLHGRGSGQGLALVREVMREHRGEARCQESALGGARIVLTFPRSGGS